MFNLFKGYLAEREKEFFSYNKHHKYIYYNRYYIENFKLMTLSLNKY